MSKNLNSEYKKHIENEIPDLWNRIEEALPSKNIDVAGEKSLTEIHEVILEESISKEANETETTKVIQIDSRRRNSRIRVFAGIAVACACCIITLPAIKFLSNRTKSETAMMDYAAEAPAYEENCTVAEEAPVADVAASEDMSLAVDEYMAESNDSSVSDYTNGVNYATEASVQAETESAEDYSEEYTEEYNDEVFTEEESDMDAGVAVDSIEKSGETTRTSGYEVVLSDIIIHIEEVYNENETVFAKVIVEEDPNEIFDKDEILDVDITKVMNNDNGEVIRQADNLKVNLAVHFDENTDEAVLEIVEIIEPE